GRLVVVSAGGAGEYARQQKCGDREAHGRFLVEKEGRRGRIGRGIIAAAGRRVNDGSRPARQPLHRPRPSETVTLTRSPWPVPPAAIANRKRKRGGSAACRRDERLTLC